MTDRGAGRATVRVLERLGQRVEFPFEHTCCGQMHASSGYFEPGLVRRYVETFAGYDAVGGPVGQLRGGDPPPARDDRPSRPR